MMRRTILSLSVFAFAGTLFLAGCEEQKAPPPPDSKTAPDKDKKTSAAPTTPGQAVAASLVAADSSKAVTCGKEGCTQPGNPAKSLVRDGKTISFCCDRCLGDYKKTNNIQ